MNKPNKEQRQFKRVYRHFMMNYSMVSAPRETKDVSQINNISQGGMNFSVLAPINVGEKLEIEIKTPFLADNVKLQGIVLECRQKIVDLIYEVRVQFKDIPQASKNIIAKIEKYTKATDN